MITTILFDLDGTLLPMDMDEFIKIYFDHLTQKMSKHGFEPKEFINTIWGGTRRMMCNNGDVTNESVFWNFYEKTYGEKRKESEKLFYEYYCNEFENAKVACQFNKLVPEIINKIKKMNIRLVLATNPIFPDVATRIRTSWAGLSVDDFECYTTYEDQYFSKPNLQYYKELLKKIKAKPEECLMVGNDVDEDMVAQELGMKVFLITDCIVNRNNKDISEYPHGSFEDLKKYINTLVSN